MSRKRVQTFVASWAAALAILVLRWTCRIRLHDDPRPGLRRSGKRYIYAVMHAHQVAAILDGEPGTAAMVSRSHDGSLIVPALKARGIVPVRGSGGRGQRRRRGGLMALEGLLRHLSSGRPAYLAVDGPRGPRGRVQLGVAALAQRSQAAVICLIPVPSRRWRLHKTWDRLQIPKPFSRIDAYFAEPLWPQPGERAEDFRVRVETVLLELERTHDPLEARQANQPVATVQQRRTAA